MYDLVIKGGRVIDPAQGIDGSFDVAFEGRKVAAVAPGIASDQAREVISASGLIVVPGLIDLHTHVWWGGSSLLGAARARGAPLRRHHARGCRQRRTRQFSWLSRADHRALAGPHPAVSEHLVRRDLRLLQDRDGRRVQRHPSARCAHLPGGRRAPTATSWSASRSGSGATPAKRSATTRSRSPSRSPTSSACRSWRISTSRRPSAATCSTACALATS